MDLQGVMKQLTAWEHPKMRAVNAKHGAGDNQFGVNLSKLRGLAAKLKRDHDDRLAREKRGQGGAVQRRAVQEVGGLEG